MKQAKSNHLTPVHVHARCGVNAANIKHGISFNPPYSAGIRSSGGGYAAVGSYALTTNMIIEEKGKKLDC